MKRDPFRNWTPEQFREQERLATERAQASLSNGDGKSAWHFTQAALWRQSAERAKAGERRR